MEVQGGAPIESHSSRLSTTNQGTTLTGVNQIQLMNSRRVCLPAASPIRNQDTFTTKEAHRHITSSIAWTTYHTKPTTKQRNSAASMYMNKNARFQWRLSRKTRSSRSIDYFIDRKHICVFPTETWDRRTSTQAGRTQSPRRQDTTKREDGEDVQHLPIPCTAGGISLHSYDFTSTWPKSCRLGPSAVF